MSSWSARVAEDLLDVRAAAAYVRRSPETVRRWVWSGRLQAERRGNRLLLHRADLEQLRGTAAPSLAEWAAGLPADGCGASAADLVLQDRDARAGR